MAITRGPKIVRNGLVLVLDAADINSYIGSGTNWRDMSGNNNNGTLINSPIFNTLNGGNFILDGETQYVTDSNIANFNVGCIDMWIKPSSLINAEFTGNILLQLRVDATTTGWWYVALGSISDLLTNEYITIVNGSFDRIGVTDGGSLAANTWVNIVINWESSTYNFYINNVIKTTSSAGSITQLTTPNVYIIGAFRNTTSSVYSNFFAGGIGIVKIYNRTLSTNELLQNYNATKYKFGL